MTTRIHAPIAGIVCALEQVPDPVFAQKIVGDGLAIEPLADRLLAPFDGEIVAVAPTGHSVTLRSDGGIELLIHIGIDTVALGGKGFVPMVAAGDRVAAGDALIGLDLDHIALAAPSLATPIVVTTAGAAIGFRAGPGPIAAGELLLEIEAPAAADAAAPGGVQATAHVRAILPGGHGIHARPAARISALARAFGGEVRVACRDRSADAKSVTSLLALGAIAGDELDIRVVGPEPRAFAVQLAEIIAHSGADDGDAVTPARPDEDAADTPLRPGEFRAVRASPGLAVGPVFRIEGADAPIAVETGEPREELARLTAARERLVLRLAARASDPDAGPAAAIAQAHIALVEDVALGERAAALIAGGASAAFAWRQASRQEEEALCSTGVARLAERAIDLRDIERQLLAELAGTVPDAVEVPAGAIIVAADLAPSFLLEPARANIGGILLGAGGATSHLAILAAARGVPMLVAAGAGAAALAQGATIVLDADRARVETAPDAARIAGVRTDLAARRARAADALAAAAQDCVMADGRRIEIFANLASADDARHAVAMGAEGCGLLRTEFLFAECDTPPGEDWQAGVYADIATALGGRPLIVRTLDAGADKPLRCLPFAPEENPALGMRGIRFSMQRPDVLATQLRAILRGVPATQLRIMLPMVVEPGELRAARALLDDARRDLGIAAPVELGAMIETPAAAILADAIAVEADFLSIGSNDLAQYALAMDRGNAGLAARIDALHPAVLRLIAAAAEGARKHGRWFGICGGIASDPDAAPLLIGLGCRELSSVANPIPAIKARVRTLDLAACEHLARRACALGSAEAVRALLGKEKP
ncbi:phosphoenolpyruvate--protein phosphotransferase [Sphingopyxis indica]|uniref:phosphoenolpyruvate--protein phosphotransferase n=1 Tax=Sphingopyxis indica TaxID=436663 RepID=A0A239FI99_9SPHN|nr:phosphoenolpyruvate--protein phosphotransferase [Sphingopyxis indica]SNS56686.1 Phosphocarrier protein HPr /phosphoenolpyruvate--protein phosphotransferase /PTS system IIA component, Glc family [Sphingopyxis indica]